MPTHNLSDDVSTYIRERSSGDLFLRDPESTVVGRRIVASGIRLLHEIGFESFTFRKLARPLRTSEASIYRYFESKHQLLAYLVNWYWGWVLWRLESEVKPALKEREKVRRIIKVLLTSSNQDVRIPHIDESRLHDVVVSESGKLEGMSQDKAGIATPLPTYLLCCAFITGVVQECRPKYKYSRSLAFTLISNTHQHSSYQNGLAAGAGKPPLHLAAFIHDMVMRILFKDA